MMSSNGLGDVSMSPNISPDDRVRPTKKYKKSQRPRLYKFAQASAAGTTCHLGRLPLEILAEILSYKCSPRDILALARCNKYFCHTLVRPSSAFIWKQARAVCEPSPIPDPTPNFTEPAYASLIFDGGECEVCKDKTSEMPISFNIRLRLCQKKACRDAWKTPVYSHTQRMSTHHRYHSIVKWLPAVEDRSFTGHALVSASMYRLKDWQEAVDELNKRRLDTDTEAAADYDREKAILANRLSVILEHGLKLIEWRKNWEKQAKLVEAENKNFIKSIALLNGWDAWHMKQSPVFVALLVSKNRSLETISDKDIESIRPTLEFQMLELAERSKQREAQDNIRKRRAAIAQAYARLKSLAHEAGFPTLSEFRSFPTARVVQKGTGPIKVEELYKPPLHDMLLQDVKNWRKAAREALGAVLGFPGWRSASTLKLHPVDRLTARFKCKSCEDGKDVKTSWSNHGLDFKAACEHRCGHLPAKVKEKMVFKAGNFLPDQKVIQAIEQVLTQIKQKSEDVDSLRAFSDVGARIKCCSCEAPIIMTYNDMLRHCNRHDNVAFELLSAEQAQELLKERPFLEGLRAKLTRPGQDAQRLRQLKVYACRHCQSSPVAPRSVDASTSETVDTQMAEGSNEVGPSAASEAVRHSSATSTKDTKRKRAQKEKELVLFTFDGLRSHAVEKHGIIWIGDEDFYQAEPATAV